ncbi:uncharacterized protein LOC127791900 isoform X5 [Diospyros lotus]|uniref:uncharacterized protein LOC127791900 isoform X5 n=1 Tax=Diospyros lotus TaxID=55363 RepID=UPI00224E01D8|nr:uncharacterized protein LOC127791900 isoform X5 [Diospyros lotus]
MDTASAKEEQRRQELEKLLRQWSPPEVPVHSIYHRKSFFSFRRDPGYEIHKLKKTVPIRGEYVELHLLDTQAVRHHMIKYEYLHFGLVQVAVKPLTAAGLDCSVLVCLRDCRLLKFGQSLLAVAQASLRHGPIYFDCYPDYPVGLSDAAKPMTSTLNIKIESSRNVELSSSDIAVEYRVYYRVANTAFMGSKKSLSIEETTFVETNLVVGGGRAVPRTIRWDSFEVPERWMDRTELTSNGD